MNKRIKSTLSFLLAIVMLVSAIPVMGTAEELDPQPTVTGTEAIDPKEPQEELLADCSILKYVDEKEFESHGFLQRCPTEEELNTYVFQLEGGQRAVYFLDENVKFVDETGLILEKDLTLVEGEEGFKTACNDIDVTLPLALEDGVSFKYSDISITVRPVTDKEASAESDERYVEYRDAFGDGTSLVYTPTLSGLKEDIVIDSKDAPETYSFTMYTNGLSLFSDEEGLYLAADEDAEENIRLGSVQLYDSGDRMGRGEIITETVSEGEEYMITLVPDQGFLQDERTVYPVTIDPTLKVSDNTYGNGSIWDAPIFQGQPNENFGDYRYDRLGTPSETGYGVGRTVVRLPGLVSSGVYGSVTANNINYVYFYAKESYGASYQMINVHPITDAGDWTESNVTWSMIHEYAVNVDYGNTMNNGAWTAFNITNLVKAWKSGNSYSASKGFIMKNSNESNNECFDSSESYTSLYRPYVLMEYSSNIYFDAQQYDVDEGATLSLGVTTNPSGATITWSSNNTSVATVNGNGVVTGIVAKTQPVTITATATLGGVTQTASCYVYVTVADGIYKLKNQNSTNLYLQVELGGAANGTDVILYPGYAYNMGNRYQIRQMWRIHHLGEGRYSIRPLICLRMGLTALNGNAEVRWIGTIDSFSNIPDTAEWFIQRDSNATSGCIIRNVKSSNKAIHPENGVTTENTSVVESNYSNTANFKWSAEQVTNVPNGVIIHDELNPGAGQITKYVAPEETRSLTNMSLVASVYYGTGLDQSVTWSSSNTSIATVNATSGAVTGVAPGTVTITATRSLNGVYFYDSYTLKVTELANGTYYLKNKETNKYADIYNHTMANGTHAVQWSLAEGNSQRWVIKRYSDDYYTIKSANSASYYYLAVENNSSIERAQIIIQSGSIANGMLWKVSTTVNGAYNIQAKTGEMVGRVLSAEYNSSNNGIELLQKEYIPNDGNDVDEWTPIRMLPTNGSELTYNASLWTGLSQLCNCYNYALNNQTWGPAGNMLLPSQQPGEYYNYFSANPIPQGFQPQHGLIVSAAMADCSMYNAVNGVSLVFTPIGRYESCPNGTYKVALVVSNADYHWYRQDSDGLWSHKRGFTEVKRFDESGELIIDPMLADRDDYSVFVGYYAVTPWNNMYIATKGEESDSNEKTQNIRAVDEQLLLSIQPGMMLEDVINIIGFDGYNVGSGTVIQEYNCTNGKAYVIFYRSSEKGFYVHSIECRE